MSFLSRFSARSWLIVLFGATVFLGWTNYERGRRVVYVTNTDREEAKADLGSPTGYVGGKRWLIVPERNNRSYQWIAETQQMLARGEWRVRHVDYENAPAGRDVHSASPYHWWLGLLAWCDQAVTGQPLGLAAERAALWADPLLHLLLLIATTIYVARQFGPLAAALLAVGLVTIFPFGGGFLPGVPEEHGLARACALWSVLPLLVGSGGAKQHQRFLLAGVAGGLGMWISAASQTPVLAGIALGGMLAAWSGTRGAPANPETITPWRTWALAGATTSLLAYLLEYFPRHMDLRLEVNHPIYGLAWIGVGEVLAQVALWTQQRKSFWSLPRVGRLVLAIGAIGALPAVLMLSETASLPHADPSATRLSWLANSIGAQSFSAWWTRDGLTGALAATCLPLLLLGPAGWLLLRQQTDRVRRSALAFSLGTILTTVALACVQLREWNLCDCMLLALLVVVSADEYFSRHRWAWSGFVGLLLLPGLVQLVPPSGASQNIEFTRFEVEGLVERSLAHWIADRAGPGGAVVLVPPDRTASWCFHGGLRGLGTANWENRDGLAATVRIVTATTADEAQALINQRGITHLILPSWDTDLDEFARWALPNPEDGFIMALHHWALPPWLRPVPYNLPVIAGFENQSVVILEVTEDSSRPAAIGRLAEYFIETKQVELAASTVPALQRFPTDLGVLVALAQVEKIRGNAEGYDKAFAAILASLSSGFDRTLAWDRRVSLAVVLAQGDRQDLAREQVRRSLEKLDATRLRALTTGSQFRLLALCQAFGLQFPDPGLQESARKMLPQELRDRL